MQVNARFINASRSTYYLRIFVLVTFPSWTLGGHLEYATIYSQMNSTRWQDFVYVLLFNSFNLFEDVCLVEFMYRVCTWCEVRVTTGDSGLCCCVHVMSLKCKLIPHTSLILCKHTSLILGLVLFQTVVFKGSNDNLSLKVLSDLSSCWYWFPLRRFCWVNESLVHSNVCFPSTACSDVWHDLNLMSVAAFDGDTSDIRRVDLDEWEQYFQSKHGITNLCTWIFHSWLLALKLLRLLSVIYTSIKHQFLVWHASLLTSSVLLTGLRSTLVMLAFPCRHFGTHLFHLIQHCAVSRISFTKLGCAYKMSYLRVMHFIWWQASKGWRKPFPNCYLKSRPLQVHCYWYGLHLQRDVSVFINFSLLHRCAFTLHYACKPRYSKACYPVGSMLKFSWWTKCWD